MLDAEGMTVPTLSCDAEPSAPPEAFGGGKARPHLYPGARVAREVRIDDRDAWKSVEACKVDKVSGVMATTTRLERT